MRAAEAGAHVIARLRRELDARLVYHSVDHTLDVVAAAERLADAEGVVGEDRELLVTAAYFHDVGFVKKYAANEAVGADLARRTLPDFGYTRAQIRRIEGLILATAIPHRPADALEQLMCDADMDYLGRPDYWPIAARLRLELSTHGKHFSLPDWLALQVRFLTEHRYFSASALRLRQPVKAQHLEQLRQLLALPPHQPTPPTLSA